MSFVRVLITMCTVLAVSGHRYYMRKPRPSPHLLRHRGIMWPKYHLLRLPTTITKASYHRVPNRSHLNYIPGTTGYETRGHGPFYRPVWRGHANTYHPRGTLRPDIVIPAEGTIDNNDITVNQIGPDGNVIFPDTGVDPNTLIPHTENTIHRVENVNGQNGLPVLPISTNTGFLEPVTPDVKEPDEPDTDTSVTEPAPVVPDSLDKKTGPETLPSIITITNIVDEEKRNNSCHVTGCSTGHECVFDKKYICSIHIPYIPCECVAGCRLDYQFIPIGQSIKIDGCGNTCSCNNIYGAAECTQQMCNPENIVSEKMFPEITPSPPATVPELKDPSQLQGGPTSNTDNDDIFNQLPQTTLLDTTSPAESALPTSVNIKMEFAQEPVVPGSQQNELLV